MSSDKFPKPVSSPTVPQAFDGEIYQAVGKYARSAVLFAFEQTGGPEGLASWAFANPDEFYTKLFPKIIARESEVTHHRSVDQLMDVIDGDYQVDGEFDEVPDITDRLPANMGQGQMYPQVAHNWNASDADLQNEDILYAAAHKGENYAEAYDPLDDVDFEE